MDLDRSANEGPGARRSGYSDRRCAGQKNGWRHRPQRIRRWSVGRMLVLAGEASSPVPLPQSVRTFCLAERNSQQARAQEHEAGRGQGKKSVGDDVVVAHVTPTTQMLARIY